MTATPPRRATLLPVLGAAALLAVPAGPAAADAAYDDCMAKAVTNPDYAQCGGDLIAREDARLNLVWKQLQGRLEAEQKAELLAEQRLWIRYKDRSCLYWREGAGREGQVIHYPACRARVIADRTAVLEELGQTLGH